MRLLTHVVRTKSTLSACLAQRAPVLYCTQDLCRRAPTRTHALPLPCHRRHHTQCQALLAERGDAATAAARAAAAALSAAAGGAAAGESSSGSSGGSCDVSDLEPAEVAYACKALYRRAQAYLGRVDSATAAATSTGSGDGSGSGISGSASSGGGSASDVGGGGSGRADVVQAIKAAAAALWLRPDDAAVRDVHQRAAAAAARQPGAAAANGGSGGCSAASSGADFASSGQRHQQPHQQQRQPGSQAHESALELSDAEVAAMTANGAAGADGRHWWSQTLSEVSAVLALPMSHVRVVFACLCCPPRPCTSGIAVEHRWCCGVGRQHLGCPLHFGSRRT
jgi:hypothetical protein